MVIEIVDGGQVKVHEAVPGVITNSPSYDWHVTNLRNDLGLQQGSREPVTIDRLTLAPLEAGSGMPGDFTPPSRFVRAAVFSASARPLATAEDVVGESLRMLDDFNIPLGSLAAGAEQAGVIPSAAPITTAADLRNCVLYFHTMAKRPVQKLDLKQIDFAKTPKQVLKSGTSRQQAVRDITADAKLQRRAPKDACDGKIRAATNRSHAQDRQRTRT